jgi:hypothetical protein
MKILLPHGPGANRSAAVSRSLNAGGLDHTETWFSSRCWHRCVFCAPESDLNPTGRPLQILPFPQRYSIFSRWCWPSIAREKPPKQTSPARESSTLAAAAELTEPSNEDGVGKGLNIEKFEAHADSGFDDAHHGKSFDGFTFAFEGDAGAGSHRQGFAGADETTAEGDVRGDAVGAHPGFEVEDLGVGGKGISDSVAAIAQANFVRYPISRSVVHEN